MQRIHRGPWQPAAESGSAGTSCSPLGYDLQEKTFLKSTLQYQMMFSLNLQSHNYTYQIPSTQLVRILNEMWRDYIRAQSLSHFGFHSHAQEAMHAGLHTDSILCFLCFFMCMWPSPLNEGISSSPVKSSSENTRKKHHVIVSTWFQSVTVEGMQSKIYEGKSLSLCRSADPDL